MSVLVCSGNLKGADNLAPEYYDAYVEYLTEVVQHYRDEMNTTFGTVAAFNEPSSRVWQLGNPQEGCHYEASTQRTILQAGQVADPVVLWVPVEMCFAPAVLPAPTASGHRAV